MRTVTANNWSIMNNLIYRVYTTEDMKQMRESFLEQLHLVVDFDGAEFYLTDLMDPKRFVQVVSCGCASCDLKTLNELLEHSRWQFQGRSLVFKSVELSHDQSLVSRFHRKDFFDRNNWQYGLYLLLGDGENCVGLLGLYRSVGKENFDGDDIYVLDLMKNHLLYRLSGERTERAAIQEKLTVTEATEHYGLTKRESAILRRLMQGQNNNQISDELQISVNTLKKHVLNIYRKLNINNRVQLFKAIKEKE